LVREGGIGLPEIRCSSRRSNQSHPPAVRYADPGVFAHAPRYHGGGFGSGLLPDEVPIIARRGELVVPPERVVREEKTAREQRPISVVVTAADASSWRITRMERAACAHGQSATRHAPLDRQRRGHLPDGVASKAPFVSGCYHVIGCRACSPP
jgi:hypothetical protein